jgi:hypothetical protein
MLVSVEILALRGGFVICIGHEMSEQALLKLLYCTLRAGDGGCKANGVASICGIRLMHSIHIDTVTYTITHGHTRSHTVTHTYTHTHTHTHTHVSVSVHTNTCT